MSAIFYVLEEGKQLPVATLNCGSEASLKLINLGSPFSLLEVQAGGYRACSSLESAIPLASFTPESLDIANGLFRWYSFSKNSLADIILKKILKTAERSLSPPPEPESCSFCDWKGTKDDYEYHAKSVLHINCVRREAGLPDTIYRGAEGQYICKLCPSTKLPGATHAIWNCSCNCDD